MYDSYDRKISYLRISLTDLCNLRCTYCMPAEGVALKPRSAFLSYEEIIAVVGEAAALGITKIRLTGGEPLVKKDVCFLVQGLKAVRGVEEVAMTTNGTLLAGMAAALKDAGLDRLNISLDTLDAGKYRTITRGGDLGAVLRGIEAARRAGFRGTKINMVLIPGTNDGDVEAMAAFCRQNGLVLQRIRRYSLREREESGGPEEAERPQACARCNRIRLTADGRLKPCLFSDAEIPVDLADIAASLKRAVREKPRRGKSCSIRGVWQIGG
jgi:cyclic pyranopterin phosphate synthase